MTKQRTRGQKLTRRAFMITGGIVGGGLLVGVGGVMYLNKKVGEYTGIGMEDGTILNAWVSVNSDNTVTIAVPRAEMGQGVYTSVPMLIAEELEVDMSTVDIIFPQPEAPYANTHLGTQKPRDIHKGLTIMEKAYSVIGMVATGGSTTIQDGYDHMRLAGAQAREMLKEAAARKWGVEAKNLIASNGIITNPSNGEKLQYGDIAKDAVNIELSDQPTLKAPKDFKIIGKPANRLDIPEKVTGQAEFGMDVRLKNMLFAVVRHPSHIKGKITKIVNKDEVESMPGVKKILEIDQGIAIVADNTWRANQAALFLDVEENDGGNGNLSSTDISKTLHDIASQSDLHVAETIGDFEEGIAQGSTLVKAEYEVPYLAHACMEPLNCTALLDNEKLDVWVGHQASSIALNIANEHTEISKENIKIHIKYLGGGFGRRAEPDFVTAACQIAKQMPGIPVQMVYTREEDMRNDMYRPAVASHFEAALGENGAIKSWKNNLALQSASNSYMNRIMPAMSVKPEDDIANIEGAAHLPYAMEARKVSTGQAPFPLNVGYWRSVGNSQNGFFTECFMDECAEAAGMDPYTFRASKLDGHPRFKAVLDKVASMANWSSPLPNGKYRGIALHKSFGSIVGQVAEISQLEDKKFKIDKYYCVIDCGRTVNPDTIEAQMQSGIVFGLSAALFGEITIQDGQIEQYNFPQYEMVRMQTSPLVEVHIMEVDEYPGGVGEPGTPPAAPALVNALYAATGVRIRSLPLMKQGFSFT
ncbi:MAG: molybdopterin-dependent oxidoreductase [Bacteroidia bacterium]|nr:molybdopterin-dependent oxidoreductase [Bacteroidia bacterium]